MCLLMKSTGFQVTHTHPKIDGQGVSVLTLNLGDLGQFPCSAKDSWGTSILQLDVSTARVNIPDLARSQLA